MRKGLLLLGLGAALLLSGCAEAEKAPDATTPEAVVSQTPEVTPTPSVPEGDGELEELLYRTWVTDSHVTHILRRTLDPQGHDLSVYFEIPYFYPEFGDYGDTQKLNRFFQDLSDAFFSPDNENLLNIWECAQERGGLSYQWNAQVTFRSRELVSVTLRYYWNAGGVNSYGSDSYTFRTDTAELLTLADVAEGSEEEVKAAILAAIEAEKDRFYDAESVLEKAEAYALEDFAFCVVPDGIQINFDSYELGRSSAEGSFSVEPVLAVKAQWLEAE